MDAALTVIGILAFGALLIAATIFASAARRFVSGDSRREEEEALASDLSPYRRNWVERSRRDRRRRPEPVAFPIVTNGVRIEYDRRMNSDRRSMA